MRRTVSIVLVAASLVAGPVAVGAEISPVFRCTVEDAADLLSVSPLATKPTVGPATVYSEFEFDTASGLLRWVAGEGVLGEPEQYEIIQHGDGNNDWVAVYKFQRPYYGRADNLNFSLTSFLRIRPWALPGLANERGRFFMIQNIEDAVVGLCEPR